MCSYKFSSKIVISLEFNKYLRSVFKYGIILHILILRFSRILFLLFFYIFYIIIIIILLDFMFMAVL